MVCCALEAPTRSLFQSPSNLLRIIFVITIRMITWRTMVIFTKVSVHLC